MPDPVLFGFPRSAFVRTARLVLEEKGVPYTLEAADPRNPAHRERHPFGKIPAFEHGDVGLYETLAIASYVNDTFEGADLMPAEPLRRARMFQWVSAINHYVYGDMIVRYVIQYAFPSGADGKPDRARIDAALPDVRHHLGVIEQNIGDVGFLSGDSLAYDDLLLAPNIAVVGMMPEGPELLEACPKLRAWLARIAARPSFAATEPPPRA